ncbi:pyridoxal-phosphate dependent enzyme [Pelomonas sp. KK5]|uniref:pyridoxal-phosphate dependent enzyme n=1 Tax=Pelomonas sp. KK5 TaxID=1855730 RepID=UPI00117FEB58|nr:pyridoxal-phosphate dependent enzyme [Pelomonas sp. KK5]
MSASATRFDAYPRARLFDGPTPIQRLHRIEAALEPLLKGARLFVKRDDLGGLGGGGSKLRKLEFLLGEALAQRAELLVGTGPRQSNSARLAAAAAARLGLRCELGLWPLEGQAADADARENGNLLLDRLFDARVTDLPDAAAGPAFIAETRERAAAQGQRSYLLPPGASSAAGALGYADCALEIADQEHALGLRFDRIVLANGSGATQAGLVAGFALLGRPGAVQGFSVLADAATAQAGCLALARECHALLRGQGEIAPDDVRVSDGQRGPGYGVVTDMSIEALRFLAAREGLLLDPVYSAKAFAGLLALLRNGDHARQENLLFLMTGGTPALFGYQKVLNAADCA